MYFEHRAAEFAKELLSKCERSQGSLKVDRPSNWNDGAAFYRDGKDFMRGIWGSWIRSSYEDTFGPINWNGGSNEMNVATRVQGSAEAIGQGASVDKYMYHRSTCTTLDFWGPKC